jgi:beta-galactosidase
VAIALSSGRIEIDDRPQLLLAGEVHYFRLPQESWADRIRLARDAGLDTIASYIPWLWHQLPDGSIDLTGRTAPERDLVAFVELVAGHGLRFFARPGPFVMAELKNEGLPYSVAARHPDARPVGWDGRPAPTSDLDYLHSGYLAEAERWLAEVLPLLADRQPDTGGPVIGVQLDNEVGMLAWVSNTPQLNAWPDDADFSGPNTLELHQQLGLWSRQRFAAYLDHLERIARDHDLTVPLVINVHGTGGGRGTTYPIGVSQLAQAYRGHPGVLAGSDYYFGELTVGNVADLYLCNAIMAAINGPDQPATSVEFEVGTGDYGDDLDALSSPESGVNKTLITIGQGNRLINYYLFCGGTNPTAASVDDGIPRIAFTGERHGFAAPVDPIGRTTPAYDAITELITELREVEPILASGVQLLDDLGYGFVADHYLTEYAHPRADARAEQVADLERHRGFGFRDCLGRALVHGGFSVGAVDLQALAAPESAWAAGTTPPTAPRAIALSTPRTLAAPVQQWLVEHVRAGGRLLLTGLLPDRDHDGRPCTILADAFGMSSAGVRTDRHDAAGPYWPTVTGVDEFTDTPDLRVGSVQLLDLPEHAVPLFREVGSGAICAAQLELGEGSMLFLGCDYAAAHLETWHRLIARLGVQRRVEHDAERPGLIAIPVTSARGNLLIMINIAPYPILASVSIDGAAVADRRTYAPRGHALIRW